MGSVLSTILHNYAVIIILCIGKEVSSWSWNEDIKFMLVIIPSKSHLSQIPSSDSTECLWVVQ